MNDTATLRVGLIGAGYVSQFHMLALQRISEAQLVGICDVNQAAAETAAAAAKTTAFTSVADLLAAKVDVVHILTPPSSHAALAIQALGAGCHVLVEKPLATSAEDCDRISAAAAKAGKQVCVNHSLLRDPFIVRALETVRSGQIGDILTVDYFRSSQYPPYPGGPLPPQYREGGFPFRDLGVHALYLMQAFLGEVVNVDASYQSAGKLSRDPNLHYDEWRAVVRCSRGTGQIQLSWNVRPIQHQLFIQGTSGTLRVDLFSMFSAIRRNTPLPKAIERAVNAIGEGCQIATQVPLNAVRFLRKKIRPYHGLQNLVAEFYAELSRPGRPDVAQGRSEGTTGPVVPTVADARPIVIWTERIAREADLTKAQYQKRFTGPLTAKVLVTGAGGFIGRHLVSRLLTDNQRLRILVRREPPADWVNDPRIEVVQGDLGDPSTINRAVEGVELIYHLGAAMSGCREDFERGTVVGTRNLIEAMRQQHVTRLVYVSSLSVLHAAAATDGCEATETWPLEPRANERGAYTQTKLAAELLVREATDLQAVILRPGQVFGPSATLLTPAVARRLGSKLVILGDGQLILPLVYVTDVVDAIVLAAKLEKGIFHVVDDGTVTQEQLARQFGEVLMVPLPVVYTLAVGVEILCRLLGRDAPLSRYRVRSALAPMRYNGDAAKNGLGWSPRVGVKRGLEMTLAADKNAI